MQELSDALNSYVENGPQNDPTAKAAEDNRHIILKAAGEWAKWTALNTVGSRFELGMAIAKALADYAYLDDGDWQQGCGGEA